MDPVASALDYFITRDDSYLADILDVPELDNVIKLNHRLFIISTKSDYLLYRQERDPETGYFTYHRERLIEEMSFCKGCHDKQVLYQMLKVRYRSGESVVCLKTNEGFMFYLLT